VLVMPSEIEFKKVDTGKAGDRVYVLQIKGSSRRFLYWMQDKSADKVSLTRGTLSQLATTVTSDTGAVGTGSEFIKGNSRSSEMALVCIAKAVLV
jgi:Proteasome complex subunit Rpn13 ubiquitin receptor